jgi:hypothetical protein
MFLEFLCQAALRNLCQVLRLTWRVHLGKFQTVLNKNRKEKLELLDGLQLRKPNAPPLPKVTQVGDVILLGLNPYL